MNSLSISTIIVFVIVCVYFHIYARTYSHIHIFTHVYTPYLQVQKYLQMSVFVQESVRALKCVLPCVSRQPSSSLISCPVITSFSFPINPLCLVQNNSISKYNNPLTMHDPTYLNHETLEIMIRSLLFFFFFVHPKYLREDYVSNIISNVRLETQTTFKS